MLCKMVQASYVRLVAFSCLIISTSSARFDHVPNVTTICVPAVHSSTASITCHFSEDLRLTMHSVSIVAIERRELNDSYVKHSVVECYWLATDTFDCKVHPGYRTNKQVTDRFSAEIPHYTDYFHGTYVCYVKSTQGASINHQCLLDGHTVDLGPLEEDDPNAWKTNVGAAVGVLLTLAVVVAGIWLIRRRRRSSQVQRFSSLNDSSENLA